MSTSNLLSVVLVCVLSPATGLDGYQAAATFAERVETAIKTGSKPDALRAIASDVLQSLRESKDPERQIWGCMAKGAREDGCAARLKALASDPRLPGRLRVLAAAGGVQASAEGDAEARGLFASVAANAPEKDLLDALDIVAALPSPVVVPVLTRLLEAGSEDGKVRAARALSTHATGESIAALAAAAQTAAPGSAVWAAVTAARARLGQPDALATVGAAHQYLQPPDLVAAGEGLLAAGDQRGEPILLLSIRTSAGADQLRAATVMRDRVGDQFRQILSASMSSRDPKLRRLALETARQIKVPPEPASVRLMLDPDASVRAAGAEYVLSWAAERSGQDVPGGGQLP